MPVFEHSATYPHPRHEVFAWHERPGAFVRLTPPGSAIPLHGPTDGIRAGSRMEIRVSLPFLSALWPGDTAPGPSWMVEHTAYEPGVRFVDEQVRGPMEDWRHEHEFADAPGNGTTITDRLTYELPRPLRGVADGQVRRYLKGLFRFREEQLRADLDLHARLSGTPQVVAVSGASGMIGDQLCALLTTGGHTVRRLVRRAATSDDEIRWDPARGELDPAALAGVDTVVNLSGRSIGGRFTESAKREILSSRVDSTTTLVRAIAAARAAGNGPGTLVQASGIGLYGARRPGELLDEESRPGVDFLADVVRQWEAAADPVQDQGVRLVKLRTGIVLGAASGALALQLPLFMVGVGGRLTDPQSMMSWIGLDDMVRVYASAVLDPEWTGAVNAVAPHPVSAGAFATRLGRVMHRPSLVPTPAFGPKLVLGREGADVLVRTDQRVSSARLESLGFRFSHPELEPALRHALAR
ncbi:hypothetical protein GA0111570_10762 [Raineyella antarctica]|uniref:TIGR01777 family protein n=1 Tax=Raineyella antarctica TaxID=1577474 RepID=A0A1G6H7W5_9ACTN|nr:TIGR01777 family oxidoreductase [Raineyella antarctica]SDB90035.1 hypothetical protein GA0111570_10762 [Raineyella antarctica]